MTLVYRAIWTDAEHHAVRVLDDEFRAWCQSKGIEPEDLPVRGTAVFDGKRVDVRRGDAEFGQVLRVSLSEDAEAGRVWTTTATAFYRPDLGGTYWVDLDCETTPEDRIPLAAPRLVRQILEEPGDPVRGTVPLSVEPIPAVGVEAGAGVAAIVLDPERDMPIAVFSPDAQVSVGVNHERASLAARTLAGIASVYVLSPDACTEFNGHLSEGFRVYGGAVRLYQPGVDLADGANALQHRFFPVYSFDRSPRRAGQLMAARLASTQQWPDPPLQWEAMRSLVMRPSEAEIAQRVSEIARERNVNADDSDALRAEINELRELLVVADSQRDEIQRELTADRDRYRQRVADLEGEHLDDVAELVDRDRFNAALQRTIREMTLHVSGDETAGPDEEVDPAPGDLTPSTAVRLARERLPFLEIHPDAEQHVDELDEALKASTWGYTTWQGLKALNTFAQAVAAGSDEANFRIWCTRTGGFSHHKVAYSESTTVKSGGLGEHRVLPISPEVDASGRMQMLWHLKIQEGGGKNIPRLYFHDDTRGVTGKIHVGFYGPHYLMPNTKTN